MRFAPVLGIIPAIAALAGCATYADAPPPAVSDGCAAYESRNWQAYINAMPGPNAQRVLHIMGEVDMPTPGYSVELIAGPADRAQPPGLRFRLATQAPGGMVTQVITATQVRYAEPTPYSAIREITIGCGDRTLATITDVPVAR